MASWWTWLCLFWRTTGAPGLRTIFSWYLVLWILPNLAHRAIWVENSCRPASRQSQKIVLDVVGYTGLSTGRMIIPRLCPFCFHDKALPVHQRIFTYNPSWALTHHTEVHLRSQSERVRQCENGEPQERPHWRTKIKIKTHPKSTNIILISSPYFINKDF